jgi:DNA topoisomerase-2
LFQAKLNGSDIVSVASSKGQFEVVVCPSATEFEQMSFVNSIWTIRGGTHVQCFLDQIIEYLGPILKARNKGEEVKPVLIKNR